MRQYVLGFAAVLLLVGNAKAVTWLDLQDGSAGLEFTGWSSGTFGGLANPPGMGFTSGAGTWSTTADTTGDFNLYAALFDTTAFAGDMTDVLGMSFDFTGGTPSGLGFYFQSDVDSGSSWFYDIPVVSGPERYGVTFDSAAGWYGFTDDTWDTSVLIGTFDAALASVTHHGLFIYFNDDQDQTYGLNDFGLTVPEPETYMILGMALLSMAMVFRKRITDSLVEARAMLQM